MAMNDDNQQDPVAEEQAALALAEMAAPPAPNIDSQGLSFIENPDGSVDVFEQEDEVQPGLEGEFDANLAEGMEASEAALLASEFIELIEQDIEARSKRDEQYADGIRRTGLGKDAPGGAEFEGASKVVHPMLAKGSVDFASRAIKELFPANGPCKTQIIGKQTEEKLDRAERKRQFMNWQATRQVEENRAELERVLSQVPLGGAQYKRWWWDPELKRPRTEAVFIDDVFMPYGNSDFYTSPRITHRQRITQVEYDRRVRTGLYVEEENPTSANSLDEESKSQAASDKVEGADSSAVTFDADGLRTVFMVYANIVLEGDPYVEEGRSAPYILHLDVNGRRLLGMFRNWREGDDKYEAKRWMTEWQFIPWRGGPAIGLAHLIGTMSGAATGSLRAILDAAHIASFPGGLKLRGGRTAGQSVQVSPTELQEIDPPSGNTDPDIRKLVMPFPFSGPSAVLFQTLEWLTQQAEQVVQVASDKIADAGANMPVGTALALIEHGSANFSAIHARLHESMRHDLEILHRLDAEHLNDEEVVEELGELVVSRQDFQGPMDIIPVSDPRIFSESQRYAQLQAVLQLKTDQAFAGMFKQDKLLARILDLLQIPDVDGIVNLPEDPERLDAIAENYKAMSPDKIVTLKAYRDQDHLTHLKIHLQFATSPMLGANPLLAPAVAPRLLAHCREHLVFLYAEHTEAAVEMVQHVIAVQYAGRLQLTEDEVQLQAQAFTEQVLAQALAPMVLPALEQLQQLVASQQPKPQPTPDAVLANETLKQIEGMKIASQEKIKMAELERKGADAAADNATQERLAQLATRVEMVRDQQDNGSKQMLAEFQAQHQANMAVLTKVLDVALGKGAAPAAPAAPSEDPTMPQDPNAPAPVAAQTNGLADALLAPLLAEVQRTLAEGIMGARADDTTASKILGIEQQQQNLVEILRAQQQQNQAAFAQLTQAIGAIQSQSSPQQVPQQPSPAAPPQA